MRRPGRESAHPRGQEPSLRIDAALTSSDAAAAERPAGRDAGVAKKRARVALLDRIAGDDARVPCGSRRAILAMRLLAEVDLAISEPRGDEPRG